MRICIVGAGYVGLVTGACFAEQEHDVTCVDLDQSRCDLINAGRSPIHEPGLDELLAAVAGRTLRATTDLSGTAAGADLLIIAVGTPLADDRINLDYIRGAAADLGRALRDSAAPFPVVMVRSTVVPGTTEGLVRPIVEAGSGRRAGESLGVGMCPEFLTEGQALADFRAQDRLVIGASDERTRAVLDQAFGPLPGVPRLHVTPRTAEMIKYASNALLATAISFANEIADLCEADGIDAIEVMRGVHLSRYLTTREAGPEAWTAPLASFLLPGCGYGGSCLPKDVRAITAHGRDAGVSVTLLEAVHAVNQERATRLVGHVASALGELRGKAITVLGLAFKPGTDDVRETPARPVVEQLLHAGAMVTVYDPVAGEKADALFGPGRVRIAGSLADSVHKAGALVLVTRWPEFEQLHTLMEGLEDPPAVIDGRRLLEPSRFARYHGIGFPRAL